MALGSAKDTAFLIARNLESRVRDLVFRGFESAGEDFSRRGSSGSQGPAGLDLFARVRNLESPTGDFGLEVLLRGESLAWFRK